jgi:osmoprotectant transport system permease protein
MSRLPEHVRSFLGLVGSERGSLLANMAAHLDLVLEAILLAALIGVPLGVLATRSRPVERVVLGLANVFQTVPSLALLGFLLILFGGTIGKPPALAALVIYALLPIIKNTVVGLRGIDRGVREAAVGMGMTPWQRLTIVELPLAVPIILGGVRIAAVASVGMATIAAAIGARGLGGYIFSGVQLFDYNRILLGAIPAALLALACDAALGEVERMLDPQQAGRSRLRAALAFAAVLALVAFALWGFWHDAVARSEGETVVIGSKDSAEPMLLGHMLAELVEAQTPMKVDRRLGLGGTLLCYEALRSGGGLDAYVEYTGTALTAILKEPPRNDPKAVFRLVRDELARRDGVACLDPLGFENTFALVMRRDQARALGVRRISDLRGHLDAIRIGFGPEFGRRPDGFPGLARAYGLRFAVPPREMDRNLLYEAVARGSIDVGVGDSTDGRIATLDLVILDDDRRFFPPYEAVPLANAAALRRHPALRDALNRLAGRIDTAAMQRLNHEVDGLHRDPATVAREFLRSRSLLGP